MRRTDAIKDWINTLSPLITALATLALVIVTVYYVQLLHQQTALHEDPILKINPNEWSITGESPGIFTLRVFNTGVADIKNIRVFQDCFVPVADSPLVIGRVGIWRVTPDYTMLELRSGESTKLQIDFSDLLDEMARLLANKKGNQYRILRLKIKFNKSIDEKEYSFSQFYIIAGHGDFLLIEEDRLRGAVNLVPIDEIRRILGGD